MYIAARNEKKTKGYKIPLTLRGSYVNREPNFEIRNYSPNIFDILGHVSEAIVVFTTLCASEQGFLIYLLLKKTQNSIFTFPHLTMWTVSHHFEIVTMRSY